MSSESKQFEGQSMDLQNSNLKIEIIKIISADEFQKEKVLLVQKAMGIPGGARAKKGQIIERIVKFMHDRVFIDPMDTLHQIKVIKNITNVAERRDRLRIVNQLILQKKYHHPIQSKKKQ